MTTYDELRRNLLHEIACARREYFRLKHELSQLEPTLPKGCYIGTYKSNYNWTYRALGHKDAVLPSATDPNKLTQKLHLGRDENLSYRHALLEIERMRIKQIKQETLAGIITHLSALKEMYWFWKPKWRSHELTDVIQVPAKKTFEDKQMIEFISRSKESIFQFIMRQYYARTYEPN